MKFVKKQEEKAKTRRLDFLFTFCIVANTCRQYIDVRQFSAVKNKNKAGKFFIFTRILQFKVVFEGSDIEKR